MNFQKSRIAYFQASDLFKDPQSFNEEKNERCLPTEFVILRFGKNFFTRDGKDGEFDFTSHDASVVIKDFQQRGKDLVIDYEHQSLSGNKAPAAGWIDRLSICEEGLTAHIKYWTDEASAMLMKGEYRYFSPTLYFSRSGKNVSAIHSVALTNHPAMHGIPALVADDTNSAAVNHIQNPNNLTQQNEQEESIMESPDTAEENIAAETTPEEQIGNITLETIAERLQKLTEVIGKLQECFDEHKPQSNNEVPAHRQSTEQLINQAYDDGKLAECHREWAYHFADTQPEAFQNWLNAAPRIIPDNCDLAQAVPKNETGITFTDEQLKIFAMLGADPEKINTAENFTI